MASEKLRKIARIVKEITATSSQQRYDISGLDLSLCKFFYRTSQHLFQDLATGDYTIDKSDNSQVLVIQNAELLKTMEAIQICYVADLVSSRYETDFNVDTNQLKDNYNKLVDDVHVIWDYIKKVGMIADDTTIPLILPQLNTDEIWVKTEDGYKGVPLVDAEGAIKSKIEEYTKLMEKRLDKYIENPLKPRLDEYVENVNKPELDKHASVKIDEINNACDRLLLVSDYKLWKADNINQLKTMEFLKVGDVVELLGNENAGDEDIRKVIISQTNDGTGVELNNGLFANLLQRFATNSELEEMFDIPITSPTEDYELATNEDINNLFKEGVV